MQRRNGRAAAAVLLCLGTGACAAPVPGEHPSPGGGMAWVAQASRTTASLRGLSVVDARVAWASGTGGTYLRTTDGGATWRADTVPGATGLDFRDVQAFDASNAYLLSAGEGRQSRIYRTRDGGRSWALQFTNPGPEGFFDGMAFRDPAHGIAYSDPVGGRFLVIATGDGGATWTPVPPAGIPPALPGEAAFAASGTGIAISGDTVWFATGGGAQARVFRSTDGGRTWTVVPVPFAAGNPAAGIFSLAFRDARYGVAVGGDYQHPAADSGNVAVTRDGGVTWTATRGTRPRGYRSGAAWVPGTNPRLVVAVGTSGSDYSADGGESWTPIDTVGFNAVASAGPGATWAVGAGGRIAKLRIGGTQQRP